MSVFTVHEPPLRAAESLPNPERFAFVRDGFSLWAFLFAPLWMLRHRMWLAFVVYVLIGAGFAVAIRRAAVPDAAVALASLCVSLLIGMEAGTLRRFALARRGWRNVGVVSGRNLEEAERRFFDAWIADAPRDPTERADAPHSPSPYGSDVVGLFPEPGASA